MTHEVIASIPCELGYQEAITQSFLSLDEEESLLDRFTLITALMYCIKALSIQLSGETSKNPPS